MAENFKYDFTSIMDRKGRDAIAVDAVGKNIWGLKLKEPMEGYDYIPMWVADMNFPTAPSVIRSLEERVSHPAFGYFMPSDAYYDAIINWRCYGGKGHTGLGLTREQIGYENGVHGFVTSAVQVLTKPGDKILLHSPVYLGFKMDVEGLGRHSVYSPLVQDEKGDWHMDYDDMDRKIKDNQVRVAIFCSPHNPTGRVWTRDELERVLEVFERNDVTVISDEIWADIVFPGFEHIPLQAVNEWAKEHVLAAYAPSKTFNLAGLIGSYHIIYNDALRKKITDFGSRTHYNEMNVLSMHALIGGYSKEGREWKDEMVRVILGTAEYFYGFFRQNYPDVKVAMPQGTYMFFLDFGDYMKRTGKTLDQILNAGWDYGVGWQDGRNFEGPNHIRVNLASPRSRIEEAARRIRLFL